MESDLNRGASESEPTASSQMNGGGAAEEAKLPRKEREKARHREEVMRAAEKLLATRPYSEISVQEIAENAEFSVGYLYKLFSSKEDIFDSLIRIRHREISGLVDRCLEEPVGVEERLRNMVTGVFAWLNDNPAYTPSSIRELLMISCLSSELATEFVRRDAQDLAQLNNLFAEGVRTGVFGESEDPKVMATTLRALMKGMVQEDLSRGREATDRTEYASLVLRVFMRAFAPEGGRS